MLQGNFDCADVSGAVDAGEVGVGGVSTVHLCRAQAGTTREAEVQKWSPFFALKAISRRKHLSPKAAQHLLSEKEILLRLREPPTPGAVEKSLLPHSVPQKAAETLAFHICMRKREREGSSYQMVVCPVLNSY